MSLHEAVWQNHRCLTAHDKGLTEDYAYCRGWWLAHTTASWRDNRL